MINEKTRNEILNDFLNGSPYSDDEKKEISVYIDELKSDEQKEFLSLMDIANKTDEVEN
jgi:hypothetical protein